MKTVTVNATMQNGSGFGVFVKVGNHSLYFDKSGSQNAQVEPGKYNAVVGGHEPSNATVTISLKNDGKDLGSQTFSTPSFFGFIPFTL